MRLRYYILIIWPHILFSQITDFESIVQSTDFHFLNIYRFGVRRISFHFVSFLFSFIAVVFLALDLAQWWEHSPIWPGFDSRFRRHMGVDFVWFLPLLREVFLRVLRFSPLLKNQPFQILIRSGYSGREEPLCGCPLLNPIYI